MSAWRAIGGNARESGLAGPRSYNVPTLEIFVSWSGERSRDVALAMKAFLKTVVTHSRPWLSLNDIGSGQRWVLEIGERLEGTDFGIICVTPENQGMPWLNFEAGALSKSLSKSVVIPYLFDMASADLLPGPLTQFQAIQATMEGTKRLVEDINSKSEQAALEADVLTTLFQRGWPVLEAQLSGIAPRSDGSQEPVREDSAKLDEVLDLVRSVARSPFLKGGAVARSSRGDIWRDLLALATEPLRSFLAPASGRILVPEKVVSIRYDELHAFHENQARKRLDEITKVVQTVFGRTYSVEVIGPSSLADRDSNVDEETIAEDDLPF